MLQTKSLGAMSASSRRQSIDGDVLRCPDEVPGPGSYAGVLVLHSEKRSVEYNGISNGPVRSYLSKY